MHLWVNVEGGTNCCCKSFRCFNADEVFLDEFVIDFTKRLSDRKKEKEKGMENEEEGKR